MKQSSISKISNHQEARFKVVKPSCMKEFFETLSESRDGILRKIYIIILVILLQ